MKPQSNISIDTFHLDNSGKSPTDYLKTLMPIEIAMDIRKRGKIYVFMYEQLQACMEGRARWILPENSLVLDAHPDVMTRGLGFYVVNQSFEKIPEAAAVPYEAPELIYTVGGGA